MSLATLTFDGTTVTGHRMVVGERTTTSAADSIAVPGINKVLAAFAVPHTDLSDDLTGVSVAWTDGAANTRAPATLTLKTWKNASGSDGTPVAATSFGAKICWLVVGL